MKHICRPIMPLAAILLLILSATSFADAASPLEVVERRIAAHNAHDIEAFLACYSDAVEVYTYPDKLLGKPGKAHLRKIFGPLFEEKAVHSTVHQMIENGDYVVVHETVIRQGKTTVYIAIHKVVDGLIQSSRFIRSKQ